jgi:cell division transport system ATP-binding protein
VIVATHDNEMVDKMRRRVIELKRGRIIRDEATGLYAQDETTGDLAERLKREMMSPQASHEAVDQAGQGRRERGVLRTRATEDTAPRRYTSS